MRELEASIGCKACGTHVGKVWREPTETGWRHVSEPDPMPKYCNICEHPLERR